MSGTTPFSEMRRLGLLSWKSLLVGLQRGWVTRPDVAEYAVEWLLAGGEDADLRIAQLADAENATDDEIRCLLTAVVTDTDPGGGGTRDVPDGLDRREEPDGGDTDELDKWRLAHLIALTRQQLDREEMLDRLDEIWAEFDYPADMEQVSRYYSTAKERLAGYKIGDPAGSRPFDALDEVIRQLARRFIREPSSR